MGLDEINILELFAGSRSIGDTAEQMGFNVFSSDIHNHKKINYVVDILDFDVKKVPFIPNVIWASPPCTYFSVASIMVHWNEDNTPKTPQALHGVKIVEKTLEIIDYFKKINPELIYYIENPRGKLRSLPTMVKHPITTVWYCRYHTPENPEYRAKPTDIWSNNIINLFNQNGWNPRPQCYNGNNNCQHEDAPRGTNQGTQGIKGNYKRSKIPKQLCCEILTATKEKLKN